MSPMLAKELGRSPQAQRPYHRFSDAAAIVFPRRLALLRDKAVQAGHPSGFPQPVVKIRDEAMRCAQETAVRLDLKMAKDAALSENSPTTKSKTELIFCPPLSSSLSTIYFKV
jgi:hypothetical protein